MPAATQPVRCIFRVKTGAFYGQEGGTSTASDGGVLRDPQPQTHPPAAITSHARVIHITKFYLLAATPLPAGGFI